VELHLGVGHGTRHDLFLPSLYPLRHPSRKVVSGGLSFSARPWCHGKSVNEKLPRPADFQRRMFQRFACSFGLHRVGVPRSIHESSSNVKLIF
ncbi:MAG: hypothetical protein IKZ13_04135, partial [Akkermansia sp.]|nr:hypothetical protein [Akkermansia sp.]